jgi:hypothetical protein
MNLFGIEIDLDKMNEVKRWGEERLVQLIDELPKEKRTKEKLDELMEFVSKEVEKKLEPLFPKIEPTVKTLSDMQVLDRRATLLYHKATEITFKAEKENDILKASILYQLSILISLEADKRMPDFRKKEKDYPWVFNRYTVALKKNKCYSVGFWACNEFFSKDNSFRNPRDLKSVTDVIEKRSLFFKQNLAKSSSTLQSGWISEAINEAKSLAQKADAITKEQFIAEDDAFSSPVVKLFWYFDTKAEEHCMECLKYSKMEAMTMAEWKNIGVPDEYYTTDCEGISACCLIRIEDYKIKL